ncbi:putative zinc-finger domain [Dillenia turbinata]|uniref:Zinc-finger domain n=1 Tax=Dillenia turbinata TaxID=194707 RepID=A0AAN8ZG07_9MAGN
MSATETANPSNPEQANGAVREEGELSSSSEADENPTNSGMQGATIASDTPVRDPISAIPAMKEAQEVKAGNSTHASIWAPEGETQATGKQNLSKNFEKSHVPYKAAAAGWYFPSAANNNLVISFSDDDSGTDSEETRRERMVYSKGKASRMNAIKRPPASLPAKSVPRQYAGNGPKTFPKKGSLSRIFSSAINKNQGVNSRNAGSSMVDCGLHARNFNSLQRTFGNREHGFKQVLNPNTTKLQDLRQQIAMRENELKLKSQQIKEKIPTLSRDDSRINQNKDAGKKPKAPSANNFQSDPGEPQKKRIKVGESYSTWQNSEGEQEIPAAQSVLALRESIRGNSDLQGQKTVGRGLHEKVVPVGRTRSGIIDSKNQEARRQLASMAASSGADLPVGCSQSDKNTETLDPFHTARLTPITSTNPFSKKPVASNIGRLMNGSDEVNIAPYANMDIRSLVDIEELHEKELEDAQEHRRRCEIEERNALKAYRKAQRALIEANARCDYLYHQREKFSAKFQSFLMGNSNLLWSARKHGCIEIGRSDNLSEENADLLPLSSYELPADHNDLNDSVADVALLNTSYRHVTQQPVGSEPCSDHDASTSDMLPQKENITENQVHSPLHGRTLSADDDEETFSMDQHSAHPNIEGQREVESFEERENDVNYDMQRTNPLGSSQDSLLLEASLRSKLFERLGIRTVMKDNDAGCTIEHAMERGSENDAKSQSEMSGGTPISEAEKNEHPNLEGADTMERGISESPAQIGNQSEVEKHSSNYASETEKSTTFQGETVQLLESGTFFPSPYLESAFVHTKIISGNSNEFWNGNRQNLMHNCNDEEGNGATSDKVMCSTFTENSFEETVTRIGLAENGSYTCNLAIDPFWPLCIFELRGKCNNEECSWQHVKDYSRSNANQKDDSHVAVCRSVSPSRQGKLQARTLGQCWQKRFSTYLAIPSLLQMELPSDKLLLLGGDCHVEISGPLYRPPLYSQNRNVVVNQQQQHSADPDQSLEKALLFLEQEVNKLEGWKKALSALSLALDAHPTSADLWIIKCNRGSYELWTMYINTRVQLDDRLIAYDTALSALCEHAAVPERDAMHASACILDLFLQMMDYFCMSGNVGRAIQRIYGFFPAATPCDESHSLLLSDIVRHLTISDKCVFWVCCVYFVTYRKLPDAVVQLFECEKDLLTVEWPPVHLTDEERQQALKLMELAVDSIASCMDNQSLECENALRFTHLFAINHVRCLALLEGFDCCRNLLEKYIKLYPYCLELVLLSARMQEDDTGNVDFTKFRDVITDWPKEIPGVQCLWNQYAEVALKSGKADFAKDLLKGWFNHVWKVQYPETSSLGPADCDKAHSLLTSATVDNSIANSNQVDTMFGWLNLSLYRLLQNDLVEARIAIDKALKTAPRKYFKHCVREYAIFLLNNGSDQDSSIKGIMDSLNNYLLSSEQDPSMSQLLSRNFIQGKNAYIRQLITKMLCPISDFSIVNSVLETWHGQLLLPQKFDKLKDLVDFVEAVMDISPFNYRLAISVCKLLSEHSDEVVSSSVLFWASSLLVDSISNAVPMAPEYVWMEAAHILGLVTDAHAILETFHRRAVSVYPFSIRLWNSYLNLYREGGDKKLVIEAARSKGIDLD